jgi:hypothetical protein
MGSDRARISYDPNQQYRSVVMQQGRVTLEADFNEELAIAGEELREETLDIVGPSGTPDDGYSVTPLAAHDFSVEAGTMYVGGLRVATPPPSPATSKSGKKVDPNLTYLNQTDWLDHVGDPDWVDPSVNPPTTEFIYLFLREQEISAVEDSDLKDVALGGPDTAQRTRLIQHIVRVNADPTCSTGLAEVQKDKWQPEGLVFNPATMRLESTATLQVGFSSKVSQPDPCNPQAQGGFLGADNQLIRVQISGIDQASGNPKFVWGFDDASFLYRLDVDKANPKLLHLQSRPVDASHQPRVNQAVEVLRSAAQLSNGEFVASLSGLVLKLDKAYDPDTQMVSLPATLAQLPVEYYDATQTPRVFLRVWEQEVISTGVAMDLGNTGLQVTLQAPGNVFHLGDYWLFAVRPSTPQQVYPERYLTGFQPPEGPRMWACPLATIDWTGQTPAALDCRRSFSPLVDLVTVEHDGKLVGIRNTLNFTGPGVTSVTDNPAAKRIDIQITGGGAGESAPTLLLFPYCRADLTTARNAFRDDTFIAVSSTTAIPFGPPQPSGPVTLYCFGTGLPSSKLIIPPFPALSPGQMTTFSLLDALVAAHLTAGVFEGYVIADCAFAGAYGFARVSRPNQGTNQTLILTDSYLAIVLPRPLQPTISSLTPTNAVVVVGGSASFTVTLTGNASANTDVQISSSQAGVANIPSTTTVLAGSASATFTATGIGQGTVTITVSLLGITGTASATLTVEILQVSKINAPAEIRISTDSGTTAEVGGSVDLNGPAPANGATVILASSNTSVLQVDPQVVVPQGGTTGHFTITASQAGSASISATFPTGTTVRKVIKVVDVAPPPPIQPPRAPRPPLPRKKAPSKG